MRKFLRRIERHHEEGNHVDANGDIRDKYGALVARGSAYHRRRRKPNNARSLEGLPVEIKVLILQNADLTGLKALVRASPSLHRVYRDHRQAVLTQALRSTLTDALLWEARELTVVGRWAGSGDPRSRSASVAGFLVVYHAVRQGGVFPAERIELRVLVPMVRYQLMIEAIAMQYSRAILAEHPVTGRKMAEFGALSGTEARRIYRALYRFDLYCALFHVQKRWPLDGRERWRRHYGVVPISRFFLSKFALWEVEEVACIAKYLLDQYNMYLRAAGHRDPEDVKKESSRQRRRSDDALNVRLTEKKDNCMALGLTYFHSLSTAKQSQRQIALAGSAVSDEDSHLARALHGHHESQQHVHRAQGISAEMFHDVKFTGEAAGPNAGFLWSKGAKPWHFDRVNNAHRDWGYVFWDRGRLSEWGVLRQNRRTWRKEKELGLAGRLISR
ncbi:hypothetical protein BJ878DRAFT_476907 [Calycina marina]|uniref:F-box domain-containing protein n=1 Tax=Calycina marina TaxID=1763456 RepID=A0A9P7Z9Y8_9HELO|nr:hypothetical protein BJ878DRAFT_476907 [Calycina marina]